MPCCAGNQAAPPFPFGHAVRGAAQDGPLHWETLESLPLRSKGISAAVLPLRTALSLHQRTGPIHIPIPDTTHTCSSVSFSDFSFVMMADSLPIHSDLALASTATTHMLSKCVLHPTGRLLTEGRKSIRAVQLPAHYLGTQWVGTRKPTAGG